MSEPRGPGPVLATRGLTKRFGRVVAVDGVDLEVPEGVRFGLLGPNGSGKTTLVRMLLGLVHATSGSAEVLGQPMPRRAAKVLPHVGALLVGTVVPDVLERAAVELSTGRRG